jgi:hypothetical protein
MSHQLTRQEAQVVLQVRQFTSRLYRTFGEQSTKLIDFACRSSLISRSLIILVYLAFSAVLSRVPYIGRPLSFLYLSLISAYYCFEYRFISFYNLTSLRSRVEFLESRWVYFIGFGIPPTLLSSSAIIGNSTTLGLTIWSLLFPLFLLTAAYSDPLPYDPVKPAKSHDLPGQELSKGTSSFAAKNLNPEARLPEWFPIRIPVLTLAVLLDDLVTGFVSSFSRTYSAGPKKSAETYTGASTPYGTAAYGAANNSAYAARRDAFTSRTGGQPGQPLASQPLSAAHNAIANSVSGFARQADNYFGGAASGGSSGPKFGNTAPPPQNSSRPPRDTYGVGLAGGVATRREMPDGNSAGVQSRKRGGAKAD